MKRSHQSHTVMAHLAECNVLTSLLLDLQKREFGYPYKPITVKRLHEASQAVRKIQQCRKQGLFT